MSLPGLLGDIPLIGADIFNARAKAEHEASTRQQEEEERKRKRRQEALAMAVQQLNRENLEVERDRRKEELRRLSEGLPPTPGRAGSTFDPDEFEARTELEVERAARVTEARERVQQQYRPTPEDEAARAGATTRAREEVQEEFRSRRPDAPPSPSEIRQSAQEAVDAYLAMNPLATAAETVQSIESEEFKEKLPPALRVLVDSGQVNNVNIQAAWQRRRGNVNLQDAQTQTIFSTIDQLCAAGVDRRTIFERLSRNPLATDSDGSVNATFVNYMSGACGSNGN